MGLRAVQIAVAGGHHLLLTGAPGTGGVMLAERLPGLLPELDDESAAEVSAIASVAGRLDGALLRWPPLQAPHHTVSAEAMFGGGAGRLPGAVSLAHRGVLLLAEAPEFTPTVLDGLVGVVDQGEVVITRGGRSVRYPARCQLVMTAHPCPCPGWVSGREAPCGCSPVVRGRYLRRLLTRPVLDRVDLCVTLTAPVPGVGSGESTAVVAARVAAARAGAAALLAGTGWRTLAEVPDTALDTAPWRLPAATTRDATDATDAGLLTPRGYHGALRVAWTIALLDGRTPTAADVAEAVDLRRIP